jgi:hypothetical protein
VPLEKKETAQLVFTVAFELSQAESGIPLAEFRLQETIRSVFDKSDKDCAAGCLPFAEGLDGPL